jgi:predicted GNAT family N-acyltransferase
MTSIDRNDATEPNRPSEHVTVVRSMDDYMRAVAIRSIVYMGEQRCPFDEEFDGNDHCGMHLLGWIDDEPVASLRIRFFPQFAKVERLAVRRQFRRSNIAFRIVRHGLGLIARKGYRRAYGHSRQGLEHFWERFGAKARVPARTISFSGHAYTEMELDLPEVAGAVSLDDSPWVLNRPEGEWDHAGILEDAATRNVSALRQAETRLEPRRQMKAEDAWRLWAGARMATPRRTG